MFVISELKDEKSSPENKKLDNEQSEEGMSLCKHNSTFLPTLLHNIVIDQVKYKSCFVVTI